MGYRETKPMLGEAPCVPSRVSAQCTNCSRYHAEIRPSFLRRHHIIVIDASLTQRFGGICPMRPTTDGASP